MYLTQSQIAGNGPMFERVTQCAATEGVPDPAQWASLNARTWAASPGWAAAWEYAEATHNNEPNYDPGRDEAVITDDMILAEVQALAGIGGPKDDG